MASSAAGWSPADFTGHGMPRYQQDDTPPQIHGIGGFACQDRDEFRDVPQQGSRVMSEPSRNCPGCGGDQPFEQIHEIPGECPDSPDGECPEWACTVCGTALIIGFVPYAGVLQAGEPSQPVRAA